MRKSLLLVTGLLACARGHATQAPAAAPDPLLAEVSGGQVTASDMQAQIALLPNLGRKRYESAEMKRQMLDSLISFEALAAEALRRGLDRKPEVRRAMKEQLIKALWQEEAGKYRIDEISAKEIEAYYRDHASEFAGPDQVRASQIVLRSEARARQIAALAKGTSEAAFRDLVMKHSQDAESKARGGEIGPLQRTSTTVPRPVVEAAFALEVPGRVSQPVETAQGYHVVRLNARTGGAMPLEAAKERIRERLFPAFRERRLKEWAAALQARSAVTRHEENLPKVSINP